MYFEAISGHSRITDKAIFLYFACFSCSFLYYVISIPSFLTLSWKNVIRRKRKQENILVIFYLRAWMSCSINGIKLQSCFFWLLLYTYISLLATFFPSLLIACFTCMLKYMHLAHLYTSHTNLISTYTSICKHFQYIQL